MSGDEDVPILHFKKHYRFDFPFVPDNMDWSRHIIRVSGISNVAVFGPDGVCVYNDSWMGKDIDDFKAVINRELKKCKSANRPKSAYVEGGTVYPPRVKKQGTIVHERMPALAAGPDGSLHLAWVSDEEGTNDIWLKSADDKGKWGKPVSIAATDADEYAPAIAVTEDGEIVVAYTADGKGDRYDIWVVTVEGDKVGKPKRVTRSPDDAMAPSLSADGKNVWLAWYEWRKMGEYSRDREVFVAKRAGAGWSKAVQVSPVRVPAYEDHSDPVVCGDGKGGAWVAWVWDYHGTLPSKPPVDENSVFVCHVDARLKTGDVLAAGFRGEGRARDYAPTLAVTPDGVPWTAWDNNHKASTDYSHKAIFANRLNGEDFGDQYEVVASGGPICSPRIVVDPEGKPHLVWAQRSSKWEIRTCALGPDGPGAATTVKVSAKEPRYPTAVFDTKGSLWVACSETDGRQWKIVVTKAR